MKKPTILKSTKNIEWKSMQKQEILGWCKEEYGI